MELRLFVGLGNPGSQYAQTRHNVGFQVVDALASRWGLSWSEKSRFKGWVAEGPGPAGKAILLKPSTYMNLSGQAARAVLDFYRLTPEQVFVIYDELALPLGKIRLRLDGSAAGHNGVKSLIEHLGTQQFPRLRVGIGAESAGGNGTGGRDMSGYVLGKFAPEEQKRLAAILDGAADAVEMVLKQGFEKTMSLYNAKVFGE